MVDYSFPISHLLLREMIQYVRSVEIEKSLKI